MLNKYLTSGVHITEQNWLLTITEAFIVVTVPETNNKTLNDYQRQEENINK